jgi:hypothetical protein
VKREAEVNAMGMAVAVLEEEVQATEKNVPSLSLSLALTLAARDLSIELGNLSLVTPSKRADFSSKEDQMCYKKVKRYVKDSKIDG